MKRWQFWVGVVISAVCLWWAVRTLNPADLWQAIIHADYWWILPGIAVYFIAVWVRAWRWHYLLRPIKKIKTSVMFPITCIGYMGNNIYPARAGEVLRAVVLKRREGVSISASLATIIVERIFDGIVMLAFIFFNLNQLTQMSNVVIPIANWNLTVQDIALWGSMVFFSALLIFLLAAMFPRVTARLGQWFIDRVLPIRLREPTSDVMHKFLDGLESLRSPANVLMVFFTSVLIWLLETVKYWLVMHAFPFSVSFFTLLLINGVVNLTITIPAAPGYVGTFDLPSIIILTAAGIERGVASAYTFVLHFALWFPITVLGAWYLAHEGIRWTDSLRAEAQLPETPKVSSG